MEETYSIYKEKKIDFCFSMRLHSIILSQIYAIPFLSLPYSKKGDL
jgi:polysaccharide pyruvyl transferase WcaK-like protein